MKQAKVILILVVVAGLGYYSYRANTKKPESRTETVARQPSQPEAVKVLEKAASALKAAKVVRYDADQVAGSGTQHIGGIVQLDRNRGAMRMAIADRRWADFPEELFDAASDGKRVVLASHMDMRYRHGAYPAQVGILQPVSSLLVDGFGKADALADELKSYAIHEGRQSVGEVECEVVKVKYRQDGEYARWYFGPDGLPRRIDRISSAYEEVPESLHEVETLTLNDLELSPELAADTFQLDRPEDYEDIEVK